MIINLFCDASIDLDSKIACGGCCIVSQDNNNISEIGYKLLIQENTTNNSAEILAIWVGITEAIKIRSIYPGAIFRLFSDSKISLYGMRDWIKNWISSISPEGILMSSSGTPVVNQQRFIDAYNLIVDNNLRIEFYHQRGHVNDGRVSIDKARTQFIKANKVSPENIGLDIKTLSNYNDKIDNLTRNAVKAWMYDKVLIEGAELEGINPIEYQIKKNMLYQYIRYIDKISVKSRHDFKGGFSQ